jgi:hypothetical protein
MALRRAVLFPVPTGPTSNMYLGRTIGSIAAFPKNYMYVIILLLSGNSGLRKKDIEPTPGNLYEIGISMWSVGW